MALISFAVTGKLICIFVYASASLFLPLAALADMKRDPEKISGKIRWLLNEPHREKFCLLGFQQGNLNLVMGKSAF